MWCFSFSFTTDLPSSPHPSQAFKPAQASRNQLTQLSVTSSGPVVIWYYGVTKHVQIRQADYLPSSHKRKHVHELDEWSQLRKTHWHDLTLKKKTKTGSKLSSTPWPEHRMTHFSSIFTSLVFITEQVCSDSSSKSFKKNTKNYAPL